MMAPADELLAALRELVATKEMREDINRRKQRRTHSIMRDPDDVRAVADLHQQCRVREYRAWNAARAIVARFPRGTPVPT